MQRSAFAIVRFIKNIGRFTSPPGNIHVASVAKYLIAYVVVNCICNKISYAHFPAATIKRTESSLKDVWKSEAFL